MIGSFEVCAKGAVVQVEISYPDAAGGRRDRYDATLTLVEAQRARDALDEAIVKAGAADAIAKRQEVEAHRRRLDMLRREVEALEVKLADGGEHALRRGEEVKWSDPTHLNADADGFRYGELLSTEEEHGPDGSFQWAWVRVRLSPDMVGDYRLTLKFADLRRAS